MFLVELMVRKNRAGKILITLANLGNKTVKVQKVERFGSISSVKIRKKVNYIETHPHRTRKSKINSNDLNVPQEHGRKIGNLIHSIRDVVANSDKESGQTQSVEMKIYSENHSPIKLKTYRIQIYKRKLVEESLGPLKSISLKERPNQLDTRRKVDVPIENQHIGPSTWIILKTDIS